MDIESLPVERQVFVRFMGWMPNELGMHKRVIYNADTWELLSALESGDTLKINGIGTLRVDRIVEGWYMNYNGDGRVEHLNVWCWRGELEEKWSEEFKRWRPAND